MIRWLAWALLILGAACGLIRLVAELLPYL